MLKFKSKTSQASSETSKLPEEFCNLSKISTYGFPSKPTALAWDPCLSLLAIGTYSGSIRIYGAPGVHFSAQHKQSIDIIKLVFVPRKGHLISLCSDNSLHLWELKEDNEKWDLQESRTFVLNGLMKRITALYLKSSNDILFLGTMCGNTYTLDVHLFEMAESVIYQDVVMQNIPDNVKLNQGGVQVISQQVGKPDCLLIGYQQGLMVLWDCKSLVVASIFVASQSLESIAWGKNGDRFMSCHSDGSYVTWCTSEPTKPAEVPINPYGPFACKAINKILWNSVKGGEDYIIFNGGMPRAVHGEKSTVTIMCSDKHEVLNLSSRVIDFFTISEYIEDSGFDNPHSLVLLLEEELLVLDLESDGWLPHRLPYLDIPHSSPVTCMQICPNLHVDTAKLLSNISQGLSNDNSFSRNQWPIKGGTSLQDNSTIHSLLVTGHENGSVKLWNLGTSSMLLLHTFHTMNTYITYERNEDSEEFEDWPPFRKVGSFDSLSDDLRLAVQKLIFNDITKSLVIGGAAGQILVLNLVEKELEKDVKPTVIHLVGDYNAAMFSTHAPLIVKPGMKKYTKGFHLSTLIQLTPPAAVTALAFHSEWNILAAGTSHGFMLFDIIQKKSIMSKCTVSLGGEIVIGSGDIIPQTQTLKKSLRESFRKLRKGWKQGRDRAGSLSIDLRTDNSQSESLKRESFASSPDPTVASSPSPELHSFSSETDSRHSSLGSVVQCVYLAQTFIINNVITTPTFWAATSNGYVCIYTITLPASENRTIDPVTCHFGKEIQLKHRAPVLSIQIIDHSGYPLPDPVEVQHQRAKQADLSRSHRVLICTEEQIKVLTLPSMKSFCKYKLTLLEQCLATQYGFATCHSKNDSKSAENCLMCLNSSSEIALYTLPEVRKQGAFQYISKSDPSVLSHFLFTGDGRFIYMRSQSEFEMCSLSAAFAVQSLCSIQLPKDVHTTLESTNSIVLEVHNISNGQDREISSQNRTDSPTNSALVQDSNTSDNDNVSASSNQISSRIKRAPLARIDELNISDDYCYVNHNGHV